MLTLTGTHDLQPREPGDAEPPAQLLAFMLEDADERGEYVIPAHRVEAVDTTAAGDVFNGALRGAGDTLFPMFISLFCLWLIRIPLAYCFSDWWGETGIWWAINTSLGIGLTIAAVYYRMGRWKGKGVIK